ncbi:MAG TPA: hypothetical protein VFK37_08755 [Bacillales bacterium]|nr:hypothetical protein [Bacillales bacterium]
MLRKWIAAVMIMSLTFTAACTQQTEGSASHHQNAVQFHTNLQSIKFPKRDQTKLLLDPNLPIELQHVQLFFNGVKPYYPNRLDEPVRNSEKQGAIIGLINQVTSSVGKEGFLGTPDSEKSNDFFNASSLQLQQLEKPSSWNRIQKDIYRKISHLEKAQDYSINIDFDGYLQTIIDQLQVALQEKSYKAYAKASQHILRLNKVIFEVAKK